MAMSRIFHVVLGVFVLALVFSPLQVRAAADAKASVSDTAIETAATPEDAASPSNPTDSAFDTSEAKNPVAAAEDHEAGGLPQLDISTYPSQIFWLLLMFAVLYTVFAARILPSIASVVDGRENMIKGNLDTAEALKNEVDATRIAYEKMLEQARAQAMLAVQDVEAAAKKKAAEQSDAFRARADGDIKSTEQRVESACDKAMSDMTAIVADVASLAAEKITGTATDRQKAQAIVETIAGKAKAA